MTEDTTALVVALERVQRVPGTLPIFDALSVEDVPTVAALLAQHPRHPLRAELVAWLDRRGQALPPPPTADDICREYGIDDLAEHLDSVGQRLRVTERSLAATLERAERAESVANAYAAVLVVVAAVALLGWAAALDYLSLFEAPPLPERPAPVPAPAPKTAP